MKKILVVALFVLLLTSVVSAAGIAEWKMSAGGGYTGTTVTDNLNGKATFSGFALSINEYVKPSYYSDVIIFGDTAYSFNSKNSIGGYDDIFSSSFGVNLIAGVGYEFSFEPVSIIIGGGLHMNEITASMATYPYETALVFDVGLGAMLDIQAELSDSFFIDLSGDIGMGLLRTGFIGDFTLDYSKSAINFNIKLGAGFKIK